MGLARVHPAFSCIILDEGSFVSFLAVAVCPISMQSGYLERGQIESGMAAWFACGHPLWNPCIAYPKDVRPLKRRVLLFMPVSVYSLYLYIYICIFINVDRGEGDSPQYCSVKDRGFNNFTKE